MATAMPTIHVYKTSVDNETDAKLIAELISREIPSSKISFDLDDCDNVLRIETSNGNFNEETVKHIFKQKNLRLETLPF
ncbi:hypothetical protein DYD21_20185 [Rhodohalobacter sp. SW132]|uniref:hypothetical protein n=1 Tax=Rhodohalobacter sp. SW132 TaxID=2293433 RepID=UPI000E275054|nr:hypothetical protein [Rhodohalobacter sp. SW132]REL24008.1 hypothetical protein DYD21_20185 [Rhodohalobacter sp. SW132]